MAYNHQYSYNNFVINAMDEPVKLTLFNYSVNNIFI